MNNEQKLIQLKKKLYMKLLTTKLILMVKKEKKKGKKSNWRDNNTNSIFLVFRNFS